MDERSEKENSAKKYVKGKRILEEVKVKKIILEKYGKVGETWTYKKKVQ